MTLLKQIFSFIFYKIGYLIVILKVYSFGRYYLSILGSEKISKFKKKDSTVFYMNFLTILVTPLNLIFMN